MSTVSSKPRPTVSARRVGYLIAVLVNVVGLWVLNVYPGWGTLPFLTADTIHALGLVSAAMIVNLAANIVFLFRDGPSLKSLGDLVTTAVALAALLKVWSVFPFAFGDFFFGYAEQIARAVLVVSIIGTAVAIIVQLVLLVRNLASPRSEIVPR